MPKVYMPKALEVVQLFAAQKAAINISLSAVGLLWNATDLLGRSRAAAAASTAAAAAATAAAATAAAAAEATPQQLQHSSSGGVTGALGGLFSVLSLSRRPTYSDDALAKSVAAANAGPPVNADVLQAVVVNGGMARSASPLSISSGPAAADADGTSGPAAADAAAYPDPHIAGRSDLSEEECTELLIKIFEHLRFISVDVRPEVRASVYHTRVWGGVCVEARCI